MTPFDVLLWLLTVVLAAVAAFDGWLLAEQLRVFRKLRPSLFLNAVAGLLAGGYAAGFCRSVLGLDLLLESPDCLTITTGIHQSPRPYYI